MYRMGEGSGMVGPDVADFKAVLGYMASRATDLRTKMALGSAGLC